MDQSFCCPTALSTVLCEAEDVSAWLTKNGGIFPRVSAGLRVDRMVCARVIDRVTSKPGWARETLVVIAHEHFAESRC